jgi:hypothetical protein
MAIDTDLAHQNERVMQAANFGWIWARECAEESFNQSKRAFDGFRHVTRKMVEDWEAQAITIRQQTTEMTEKILSNTLEFGQKLVRAKEPLEFAQCQNEFMARQAQTIADQTREFSQKLQQAAQTFASDASSAMAETSRRSEETVSNIASRAEQTTRRQRP